MSTSSSSLSRARSSIETSAAAGLPLFVTTRRSRPNLTRLITSIKLARASLAGNTGSWALMLVVAVVVGSRARFLRTSLVAMLPSDWNRVRPDALVGDPPDRVRGEMRDYRVKLLFMQRSEGHIKMPNE